MLLIRTKTTWTLVHPFMKSRSQRLRLVWLASSRALETAYQKRTLLWAVSCYSHTIHMISFEVTSGSHIGALKQSTDCKVDTTWKTFQDTHMTRTDKSGLQQWTIFFANSTLQWLKKPWHWSWTFPSFSPLLKQLMHVHRFTTQTWGTRGTRVLQPQSPVGCTQASL